MKQIFLNIDQFIIGPTTSYEPGFNRNDPGVELNHQMKILFFGEGNSKFLYL